MTQGHMAMIPGYRVDFGISDDDYIIGLYGYGPYTPDDDPG